MARVASFEFYDDAVAHTGASTCTINWTAQTVVYPGVSSVGFAYLTKLADVIDLLADQDISDGEVDIQRTIYKADGTTVVSVLVVPNVIAGTVTSVTPGAAVFSKSKAKDLAQGLRDFVIAEL